MAQFARMFDSWALLTQYVFYILLVLLPLTAWRKREHVGEVYGLLILSDILMSVLRMMFVFLYIPQSGVSSAEGMELFQMLALAQGIALGGTIFLLLVLGLLYQWKKGGETRRLKRWMFAALVITAALFFFLYGTYSEEDWARLSDLYDQVF